MNLSIPQIKIKTHNSAMDTGISGVIKNNRHAGNPSFGFKPIEIKDEGKMLKFVHWLDSNFDSAWQRLVSGITALFTQPFFDLNNKRVDEDTRKTSTARTLGKIIAGTLTGVLIREGCIQAVKKCTQPKNLGEEIKNWKQCLLPKSLKDASNLKITRYRGAFGTYAAIIIMIATNFLIDAPLTTKLANYFNKQFHKNAKKPAEGGK
ncbi:MAG: hypothetical protein WCY19_04375 [Candidatus Gastranaerophilaceae bacterium]